MLPDGVSALPGPVRLWPFQREIADAIGDAEIGRVTLVKPVRVPHVVREVAKRHGIAVQGLSDI